MIFRNIFGHCPISLNILFLSRVSLRLRNFTTSGLMHLTPEADLGLDRYYRDQTKIKILFGENQSTFMKKMVDVDKSLPLHSTDVKNVIFLSSNEADARLAINTVKRYLNKSDDKFIVGPQVMRMLHQLKLDELSLELFNSKESQELFQYRGAFNLLLDLLYETRRYDEVLTVHEEYLTQHPTFITSITCNVVAASCIKMKSPRALQYFTAMLDKIDDVGIQLSSSTYGMMSYFALEMNKPDLADYLLRQTPMKDNLLINNLKVLVQLALEEEFQAFNLFQYNYRLYHKGFHTFQEVDRLRHHMDNLHPNRGNVKAFGLYKELFNPDSKYMDARGICEESLESYILTPFGSGRKSRTSYKRRKRSSFLQYMKSAED